MRRIAYNIAPRKQVDCRRLAGRCAALFLAALLIDGAAIGYLQRQARRQENRREESHRTEGRLRELAERSSQFQVDIVSQKVKWSARLAAANQLIRRKNFSFISRLNRLESLFPADVRLLSLTLVNAEDGKLGLTLAAPGFAQLVECYRRLAPYQLVVTSEAEKEGLFEANLQLVIRDANE